jgi:uncharacterized repeat protein (TIGR02543 family)
MAAALLLFFFACEVMGPETGTSPVPDGKAAPRIAIEAAGGRTALPTVDLSDVTAWKLFAGTTPADQTLVAEFSAVSATVYLEIGTWDFTLKGYTTGDDLILAGNITSQPITLEGPNALSFTVAPVMEGDGSFKITVNLPVGHGITKAEVFTRDGTKIDEVTPDTDKVVFENNSYASGDHYFSIRLYKGSDLYGVVSETVQVRANLRSEGTHTLTPEDLNLTYVITYHLNDGQLDGGVANPGYYHSTDANLILPIPARTGYASGGWYEDADLSGSQVATLPQGSAGDKAFYAKWTAISYTVAYDKNAVDASGTTASSAHTYDEAKALAANGFARTGYTFAGWNTQADGGGTNYDDGQSVQNLSSTDDATVTLYAQWTAISYDIDYHLNGGTNNNANPDSYTSADLPIALAAPNRTGYAFGGWHDDENFSGSAVAAIPAGNTGDKAFYAKWTAINYTVAYDKNAVDASGTTASSSHTYGTASALTANGFARTGYTFAGWNTQADGGGTGYADGAGVTDLSATAGATTLYAQWTGISSTECYNDNGGSGTTVSSYHTYGTASALTANSFTKTGYAFAGWNTQAGGGGTGYADRAGVTDLSATAGTTVTLYAQWTPIVYTVAYNANGGEGTTVSSSHTYDEAKALTANSFARTGYTFAGWNTQAGGGGTGYTDGQGVTNLSATGATVNLYAQWTGISYTVAYNANGGSGTIASSSHTYGTASALTANSFTKIGYAFAGWNTQADDSGTGYADREGVTDLSSTAGATVTLYARWTPIVYTVAYNANGGEGTTASSDHTYDAAQTLVVNGFTRTGFSFVGWNTQAGGGGTNYDDEDSVTNLSSANGATVTLYAQWWPTVSVNISLWVNDDRYILYSNNDITISKSKGPGLDIPEKFSATLQDPSSYSNIQWELNGAPIGSNGGGHINIEAVDYPNGTYTLGVIVTKNGISYSTDIRFTVIN